MVAAIIHVALFALPFFCFIAVIGKKEELAPLGCLCGIIMFFVITQTKIGNIIPDVPQEIHRTYQFAMALFIAFCMSGATAMMSLFITICMIAEKRDTR